MGEQKLLVQKLIWHKLSSIEREWLEKKTTVSTPEFNQKFSIFFSQAARHIENLSTLWESSEVLEMEKNYPGFDGDNWTKRDLARVYLMLSLQVQNNGIAIKSFFEIAEMNELIALYKGLFFLKNANEFTPQVKEGIRTNMVNVFDAICLGNPYAAKYLEDAAWNQMILKAVFMERPLFKIQNIDERYNKDLAWMLQDYIKERWAANRNVSPEIWRMAYKDLNEDIKKLLLEKEFTGLEKQAVIAVLNQDSIQDKEFWDSIGKRNILKV